MKTTYRLRTPAVKGGDNIILCYSEISQLDYYPETRSYKSTVIYRTRVQETKDWGLCELEAMKYAAEHGLKIADRGDNYYSDLLNHVSGNPIPCLTL
jgi:hypothetical protein